MRHCILSKKNVADLTWPASQIKRAEQYQNLHQDIAFHQQTMKESLKEIKDKAHEAQPFLLSKAHGSAVIEEIILRLDNAIETDRNDDVQNITHEFLQLLQHDGSQLEAIARVAAQNQKRKEDELNLQLQIEHEQLKNAYQSSIREVARIGQQKNKQYVAKKMQEKKELEEKNKKERLALQQVSIACISPIKPAQNASSTAAYDKLSELTEVITDIDVLLQEEMNESVFKKGLAYVEKSLKRTCFNDCKQQLSAMNEQLCSIHILLKNLKKIEKKDGKNKAAKLKEGAELIVFKLSELIVHIRLSALEQKNILLTQSHVSNGAGQACSSYSSSSSKLISSNSELEHKLVLIKDRAIVLIKQQLSVQTLEEIRAFINETLFLPNILHNSVARDLNERLMVPAEAMYRSGSVLLLKGDPASNEKISACLHFVAVNYSHILKAIQQSVQERLTKLSHK